jgi:hypothetical protein
MLSMALIFTFVVGEMGSVRFAFARAEECSRKRRESTLDPALDGENNISRETNSGKPLRDIYRSEKLISLRAKMRKKER